MQVRIVLASHPCQRSPDLAQPSVPSGHPLPHHSSCTESQPFPWQALPPCTILQRGRKCVYYIWWGDGQWGPQILPKLCPPHPAPSPVPVQCLSLLSLTCRDSGQVPPFLALQSAENRHADLQTGDREGLHGQWIEVPFLNPGPPHPTVPPDLP